MRILVIEEDMCSEGFKKFILTQAAKEVSLIDIYTPFTQSLYHSEV